MYGQVLELRELQNFLFTKDYEATVKVNSIDIVFLLRAELSTIQILRCSYTDDLKFYVFKQFADELDKTLLDNLVGFA